MSATVVIVNWNGWPDTVECLESVFRMPEPGLRMVVCDNDSSDGSLRRIIEWCDGRLDPWTPPTHPLRPLSFPPLPKPLRYVLHDRDTAEAGGTADDDDARLVLVHTGGNLGFAGGTNVGLRYALARAEHDCVWILNNDTVVDAGALRHLRAALGRGEDVGIVGSTLMYYDDPERVQTCGGGWYNHWLALSGNIGRMTRAGSLLPSSEVSRRLSYVAGASMLVSREFLQTVGLLNEEYFLYFEELDWAMRARGRFQLAYAPESVVYHKEGRSIGGGSRSAAKSWTADYYAIRNRLLFTRKHVRHALPTVYLALLVAMARRAGRGEWDRARMIGKVLTSRGGELAKGVPANPSALRSSG